MADAAPSGAKITGAEIILLVILALGALGFFFGNPLQQYSASNATTSHTAIPTTQCGIVLSRPKKSEKILQVVTITGTITLCNQTPSFLDQNDSPLATELHAQIVDGNGTPMSAYTPITIGAATSISGTFDIDIPITGAPVPGTGYAIVIGPTESDGTSVTARVPITF